MEAIVRVPTKVYFDWLLGETFHVLSWFGPIRTDGSAQGGNRFNSGALRYHKMGQWW